MPVTTTLLSDDSKSDFVVQHRADYEALRKPTQPHVSKWCLLRLPALAAPQLNGIPKISLRQPSQAFVSWTTSRWPHCASTLTGRRSSTPGVSRASTPRIFDHPEQGAQARQIFAEANTLLDRIIEKNLITAPRRLRLLPSQCHRR